LVHAGVINEAFGVFDLDGLSACWQQGVEIKR
jgi:hypothetical protein